jgi:hypothetical protein
MLPLLRLLLPRSAGTCCSGVTSWELGMQVAGGVPACTGSSGTAGAQHTQQTRRVGSCQGLQAWQQVEDLAHTTCRQVLWGSSSSGSCGQLSPQHVGLLTRQLGEHILCCPSPLAVG